MTNERSNRNASGYEPLSKGGAVKMNAMAAIEISDPDINAPKPLSKMDIKAIRGADSVVFRLDKIECIKKVANDPYESERRYIISVHYDGIRGVTKAFHMIHSAKFTPEWDLVKKLVRKDDELTLHWDQGGQTHDLMREKGLIGDALYLRIRRNGKDKYTILIEVSISTPSHRMVE